MELSIKNVKVNLQFSQETTMFMCDLYVNGIKVGYSRNDGCGGCSEVHGFSKENNTLLMELDKHIKETKNHSLEDEIDILIDNYINEKERKKFQKKMERDMLTKLVLGTSDPDKYHTIGWKGLTIRQVLSTTKGVESLVNTIKKYKDEGYVILNTNIPEEFK